MKKKLVFFQWKKLIFFFDKKLKKLKKLKKHKKPWLKSPWNVRKRSLGSVWLHRSSWALFLIFWSCCWSRWFHTLDRWQLRKPRSTSRCLASPLSAEYWISSSFLWKFRGFLRFSRKCCFLQMNYRWWILRRTLRNSRSNASKTVGFHTVFPSVSWRSPSASLWSKRCSLCSKCPYSTKACRSCARTRTDSRK